MKAVHYLMLAVLAAGSFVGGRAISERFRTKPTETQEALRAAVEDDFRESTPAVERPAPVRVEPAPAPPALVTLYPDDGAVDRVRIPLADLARHFLSQARNDAGEFGDLIRREAAAMSPRHLESAVWALAQVDPTLAESVAASVKTPDVREMLGAVVAKALPPGDFDRLKSLSRNLKLESRLFKAAIGHWADVAPDWARARLESGEAGRGERYYLLAAIGRTNPDVVWEACRSLPPGSKQLPHLWYLLGATAASQTSDEALAAFRQIDNGPVKSQFLFGLLNASKDGLDKSLLQAIAGELSGPDARLGIPQYTNRTWELVKAAKNGDPEVAESLAENLLFGHTYVNSLYDRALNRFGADYEAAFHWTLDKRNQVQPGTRDDNERSEMRHWMSLDPDGFTRWIGQSGDDRLMQMGVSMLRTHHQGFGEEALRKWENGLPPSLRALAGNSKGGR